MRILIVSQYFWPESFIINDLARALAAAGHEVTVATGKPNYPNGVIAPGYRRAGVQRETFADGIEIVRVPVRPRGRARAWDLLLNYASFVVSAGARLPFLLRGRTFDAVFFFGVSPMTAALPAVLVARLKKAHLSVWVQDLWPESLSATGFVTNRLALSAVGFVVKAIYRAADTLLLQSEAFAGPMSAYADPQKFEYFPNVAPDGTLEEKPPSAGILDALAIDFPIVFAGNLGRVQSLSTILDAARLLRCYPDIRFVLVGTGSEAAGLARAIESEGLSNIRLTGLVDRSTMPGILRRAAALLVTLRKDPALNLTIPSKIQAYMQAGRPVIAALDGEAARIVETAGAGLTVPAEDGAALAKSILTLYSMPANKREAFGVAARRHFEAHFEAGASADRLIQILQARMGGRR